MKAGQGLSRGEWEVGLTPADADALWPQTEGLRIQKTRDRHVWKGLNVEVDRYQGTLQGLTVAEVEFPDARTARSFTVSKAFGPEVTYDPRFKNRALAEGAQVPRSVPGRDSSGWAYGVVPYRRSPLGWEMLIVTTRRQDRWIFPKGQPETGLTAEKVALTEAREEAGAGGRITGHPIVLPYERDGTTTNLLLFPLLLTALADRWLELGERDRKMIPLEQASSHGDLVQRGAQWLSDFLKT
jgi:8-oxo-dGTP pyrophosphatase MutT (NUDIX family)